MSTSSDPPGRSSSDSRHYPQRDLQYQYPQRSPNRRSTPSISRFSEPQQHHHRDHYNAPTPPIPLPLPLVAAPAPPSTTSSSSVSSWSSAGGLGGDRHTHRIMEPKPLRIPYGLSSGPARHLVMPSLIKQMNPENDPTPPILSNAIYERHLLKHRHGFPLWSPHPSVQLPKSYVDKGVRVGDVGIITQYGAFDYLFNICLPAEHPNNSGPLPDGFVPLLTQQKDISESPEHPPNSCFCSSVKQASHLSFESTASEGAILILPEGAHHEDIRNLSKFREYAAHHAHSWYKFANGVCGREIENGELHLVTGCDKTANWGMAAFSGDQVKSQGQENQSQQQEHQQLGSAATSPVVTLTFTTQVGPDGESPVYSWEKKNTSMYHGHPGHIHVEAKSSSSSTSQSPISATTTTTPSGSSSIGATPGTERSKNQCTFVRSHTISLSDDEWSKVMASINVGTAASGGGDSASDTSTIDLVAKRSRNTLKRFFSSFGPKSSNLLAKSPGGSTLMFPEFPSRGMDRSFIRLQS
ncbi:hypothetical protein CC1G_15320 [Coprinopsis cinerea okayama7|uniref:Uncharacterized protein n=1 Tax=Coprinopsis cinerea (strain Okayama-7 / 130 / ATCC MYA-4618 / FGSC 9003) TaxID=240176 RepID=D6RPZ9_COPC7|nr:hypothetical protein CC1G_15320 [Coprinopsis cinerea okayama7\|eukprot:XP_002910413.1 hypothetical protein CC1G_15320 [Coprinopsis cinerea okayama7\